MKRSAFSVVAVGLTIVLGNLNASTRYWHYWRDDNYDWWRPHRVEETIRTDQFTGEIKSRTQSIVTVQGHEIVKRVERWSCAYRMATTA